MHAGDNIGSVEVALSMSRHEHEHAHGRHGHRREYPGDGGPHQEIAQEALGRAQEVDEAGPVGGTARNEVVQEAREDTNVGPDVLGDRERVER